MDQVVYTDHTGRRQVYCTIGQSVLGRGPEGTMRQCRAWLSSLYVGHPGAIRYAVRQSVRVERAG
jgi:hypothetical protein